jgi:hypothetical protein
MSDKKQSGSPPTPTKLRRSLSSSHHTGTLNKPGAAQGGQSGGNQSGGGSGDGGGGSQDGNKTEGDKS